MESAQSSSELFLTQQLQAAHDHIAKLSMEKIGLGAQKSKSEAQISELKSEREAQISELAEVKEQLGQMVKTQDLTKEIDKLKTKIQELNQQVEENKTYITSLEEEKRLDDLRLKQTTRGCEQMFIQKEQALRLLSSWPKSVRDIQDMVNEQTEREGGPDPHVEAELRQGSYKLGSNTVTKRGRGLSALEPMAEQCAPSLPPPKKLKAVEGKLVKHQDENVSVTAITSNPTPSDSNNLLQTSPKSFAQALAKNRKMASKPNASISDRSVPSAGLPNLLGKNSGSFSKPIHPTPEAGDKPKRTEGLTSSTGSGQAKKIQNWNILGIGEMEDLDKQTVSNRADTVQESAPVQTPSFYERLEAMHRSHVAKVANGKENVVK